ncbi:MAG: DUF523 domain-containing protein [Clostridia bacterium]|nr:DUF523 domain-containing protein [Clostridia bacterium]
MKRKLLVSACLLGIGCRYDGGRVKKINVEELTEAFDIIPICPEIYGGLPTPRVPSERMGERVVMKDGTDVTENFERGALYSYELALAGGADIALLKAKSPSCGKGEIYDGSFTGRLTKGDGYTAEYLMARGIKVYTENEIAMLFAEQSKEK